MSLQNYSIVARRLTGKPLCPQLKDMSGLLPVYACLRWRSKVAGERPEGERGDNQARPYDYDTGDREDEPWPIWPAEGEDHGEDGPHQGVQGECPTVESG